MPKKLTSQGTYFLDIMERLDQGEYEQIVGPAFRQLSLEDLHYLSAKTLEEIARRHPRNPGQDLLSSQNWEPLIT